MGNLSQQDSGHSAPKVSQKPPQAAIDLVRGGKSSEIWDPLARMVRVVKVTPEDMLPKPEPPKDKFDLFLDDLAAGKVELPQQEAVLQPEPVPVEDYPYPGQEYTEPEFVTEMNVVAAPDQITEPVPQKQKRFSFKFPEFSRKLAMGSATAFAVLIIGVFGLWKFAFNKDSNSNAVLGEKTVMQIEGVDPEEVPVTIKVVDKTKVTQEFLGSAENGDKVLLYYKSKKAVLYRPRTNEIIKSGEFTPPPPKVFVRQGSAEISTEKVQGIIAADGRFKFESSDKSPTLKHSGIIIVDITKRYDDELNQLAKLLNATIQPMPQGESPPDADFLVIVGR